MIQIKFNIIYQWLVIGLFDKPIYDNVMILFVFLKQIFIKILSAYPINSF